MICNEKLLRNKLTKQIFQSARHSAELLLPTIIKCKQFCLENNVIIVEADKNAGICLVNKSDYYEEVFRQLNDLHSYFPTTKSHFELKMIEFRDKVNVFDKNMPEKFKLRTFLVKENKPANFYILPKIHKKFDKFP